MVYDYVIDGIKIGDKTIAGWVSKGTEGVINQAGKLASNAKKKVEDGVDAVGKELNKAKNAVGNFVGGIGKAVFGG